jgi:two-component system chemotaxis response regulator CheY
MAKTILIVDDSTSLRQIVKMALDGMGYDVLEAADGQAALALLDGREIGLVISDLNMPKMNGFEFVKAAKAKTAYRFLTVLMLTTESQTAKKEEGKAAGVKAWMTKPFTPSSLQSAVSKLCPL